MTNDDITKTLETAAQGPETPLPLFQAWLARAETREPNDPNAMCLATSDSDGRVSARIVLLKAFDDRGFVFFTNRESQKGRAIQDHPRVALCFHWKSLLYQIRIEGNIELVSDDESDAYYNTRPRGSRIGAWASQQSRELESRQTLQDRVRMFEEKFKPQENIPRPPYWGGYRLVPDYFEFWDEGNDRLHTRLVYERAGTSWRRKMLYP